MQTHSKELQQVLDIVVSHQALQLKCELVVKLLSGLVAPRPQHFRPLLRRLAGLIGESLLTTKLWCTSLSVLPKRLILHSKLHTPFPDWAL